MGRGELSEEGAVLGHVSWSGYGRRNVTLLGRFAQDAPLSLRACGYADFGLAHAAPVFSQPQATGAGVVALLGEVGKFVPIAVARVVAITMPSANVPLTVSLEGSPNEVVEFAFAVGSSMDDLKVAYVSATMSQDGTSSVSAPSLTEMVVC